MGLIYSKQQLVVTLVMCYLPFVWIINLTGDVLTYRTFNNNAELQQGYFFYNSQLLAAVSVFGQYSSTQSLQHLSYDYRFGAARCYF